jgi:pimeloyl-ACP methyl ester carboxylesterase
MHDGPGFNMNKSALVVASSTVEGTNGSALMVAGGTFEGWDLRVENASQYGIFASAFTDDIVHGIPQVVVRESSFEGNGAGAARNVSRETIDLRENWWGTAAGPSGLRGPISVDPWLVADPTDEDAKPLCCSSVLFIPGLEGTRLYEGDERLWEPVGSGDVSQLWMDASGQSLHAVRAGEPLDSAYGIKGIYGSFMRFLDGLVASGTIREWKPFGYDWRRPIDEAITPELVALAERLASSSPTGRVTLIAHSNGGLVAERLVQVLEDKGETGLVDAVVSVAVPYLGAPEAVAGLLHGDGQSILGGLLASKSAMRELGRNMPSAYSLLPSAAYFASTFWPSVAFASTSVTGLNDGAYPPSISDAADQAAFISDTAHVRMEPTSIDIGAALRGNATLLHASEAMHTALDAYDWPFSVIRWAIAGTGEDTPVTIEYDNRPGCSGFVGKIWCRGVAYFHRLKTSILGDGTVPFMSAIYGSPNTAAVDLSSPSEEGISHANIMESSTTQETVKRIILAGRRHSADMGGLDGVATSVPEEPPIEPSRLSITAHSDVDVRVYDSSGRQASADMKSIPSSYVSITGSGDDKYTEIRVPSGGTERYAVAVHGNGYGFFTVGVGNILYETMPNSPIMSATTTIDAAAGSLPPLSVDIDSDGAVDYHATPDGNGLPGNATSTAEADRIAKEQSLDVLEKTDTDALRNDPARIEFVKELFPPGTNGAPLAPPQQKTPPSGSVPCVTSR